MYGGDKDKDKSKANKKEQTLIKRHGDARGCCCGEPVDSVFGRVCWQSSRINPIAFAIQLDMIAKHIQSRLFATTNRKWQLRESWDVCTDTSGKKGLSETSRPGLIRGDEV